MQTSCQTASVNTAQPPRKFGGPKRLRPMSGAMTHQSLAASTHPGPELPGNIPNHLMRFSGMLFLKKMSTSCGGGANSPISKDFSTEKDANEYITMNH